MLKKFTVSNYRSFENPITIDFTNIREYDFNEECIKDGLINKAVIYGENAVGKTNFGKAILDIVTMIQNGRSHFISQNLLAEVGGFKNVKSDKNARFEYLFQFNDHEIEYIYEKSAPNKICFESFKIDQKLLYEHNFTNGDSDFSEFKKSPELMHLNLDDWDDSISVIRYILSHAKLEKFIVLKELQIFVSGMFNLQDMLKTDDKKERAAAIIHSILESEEDELRNILIQYLERFLRASDVDVRLKVQLRLDGKKELYFDYGNNNYLPFLEHASSGTLALVELSSLFTIFNSPTFLYIDEFDAHFHFAVAKSLLELFKQYRGYQTVITTHNTDLMSNKFMRPDCYLLMTSDKITNLADATDRILRLGHDLENLYQAGEFNEIINQLGDEHA